MSSSLSTEEVHRQWRLDNLARSHPPHIVDGAEQSEYIWIPKEDRVKPPWIKGTRPWVVVGRLRLP